MNYPSTQGLASLGRNGDSMLVHMSPSEVAGLQGLAMAQGGSLTINPKTGLPEAFKLGGFFKSLLPTLVGAMTGGAGLPLYAGIAAGAATGALTNKNNRLLGAITGGLGGYSGFGIGNAFKAAGTAVPTATTATAADVFPKVAQGGLNPADPLVLDALKNQGINTATGSANTIAQISPYTSQGLLSANPTNLSAINYQQFGSVNPSSMVGPNMGQINTVAPSAANVAQVPAGGYESLGTKVNNAFDTYGQNLSTARTGAGEIFSGNQNAIDAYTKAIGAESGLGAIGKTLLPVGGAALGGLEETDIYGKPMQKPEAEKYDPYARLDLSNDTGLRLVAKGGYIDGYATGGTIQSGGIRDLYGTPDNQPTISPGLSGFGLGRLNNLAGEQAITQAQTLGYAEGGVASLDLPEPSKTAPAPENLESMILNETAKTNMLENQLNNMTSNALNTGSIPTQNYAPGAFSNVASAMQNQSVPPQASFVQNLTGARTGYAKGGYLNGAGDGMSDSIPATIEGKQPARLADGEFVIPADVVSHLGNGSTKAGSKRLYAMLDKVRKARTGHTKQGKQINPAKYMPA
jgi:hypothetical protein